MKKKTGLRGDTIGLLVNFKYLIAYSMQNISNIEAAFQMKVFISITFKVTVTHTSKL